MRRQGVSLASLSWDWSEAWEEFSQFPIEARVRISATYEKMRDVPENGEVYNHDILRRAIAVERDRLTVFDGAMEEYEEAMRAMELLDGHEE